MDVPKVILVVRRMALKDAHIPILAMLPTLHGKRDFAEVMKLQTLKWGVEPGLNSPI